VVVYLAGETGNTRNFIQDGGNSDGSPTEYLLHTSLECHGCTKKTSEYAESKFGLPVELVYILRPFLSCKIVR
jgi:hypothetical protein